jgi:hypothetical protein
LFTLAGFFENCRLTEKLWNTLLHNKNIIINWLGLILGDFFHKLILGDFGRFCAILCDFWRCLAILGDFGRFFTNSSGHPGSDEREIVTH